MSRGCCTSILRYVLDLLRRSGLYSLLYLSFIIESQKLLIRAKGDLGWKSQVDVGIVQEELWLTKTAFQVGRQRSQTSSLTEEMEPTTMAVNSTKSRSRYESPLPSRLLARLAHTLFAKW